MRSIKILPTIVPAAPSDIEEASKRHAAFASFFQIDITDGKFAPNTTWLPRDGYTLPREYDYEVHLMVEDPVPLATIFAKAGARRLIVHVEALESDIERVAQTFVEWKRSGVQEIGLAVLLQTPFEQVEPYLSHIDFVLLMTIPRIGVQGIPYDTSAPARVSAFHTRHPEVLISVDGGVSETNIADLVRAGATRFGVGSAIAKAGDPASAFQTLKTLAENASM